MSEAESYHLRRVERDMPERAEQLAVIRGQKFMTIALARDNEPYLVNFNYAFDESGNCFYVHSAPAGKKLDYLRANPRVWGQVIEDRGYVVGECSHAYRSVMFRARAEFIASVEEKRRALALMIDHADPDPAAMKARLIENQSLETVTLIRLRVEMMTGKAGR